jgi:hypothetical protein
MNNKIEGLSQLPQAESRGTFRTNRRRVLTAGLGAGLALLNPLRAAAGGGDPAPRELDPYEVQLMEAKIDQHARDFPQVVNEVINPDLIQKYGIRVDTVSKEAALAKRSNSVYGNRDSDIRVYSTINLSSEHAVNMYGWSVFDSKGELKKYEINVYLGRLTGEPYYIPELETILLRPPGETPQLPEDNFDAAIESAFNAHGPFQWKVMFTDSSIIQKATEPIKTPNGRTIVFNAQTGGVVGATIT